MFRIDRRLVKVSEVKLNNFDKLELESDSEEEEDELPKEVDAEGEVPDAETSVEAITETEAIANAEAIAENVVNEYLSAAKSETETKIEAILENARIEADNIVSKAHDEADEERERARKEGFEEGAEEGRRSYDDRIAEKNREQDEELKRVLDKIYEDRERAYAELEGEVVELALDIVRKIINPAEEALGDVFLSLIKNALKQMSTDNKVVIRVSPEEYERFFSSGAATIELDSGITVKASVLRDISLQEGDCIIDTEDVTVNAGVESQLQYVKLAFERANQYEPD